MKAGSHQSTQYLSTMITPAPEEASGPSAETAKENQTSLETIQTLMFRPFVPPEELEMSQESRVVHEEKGREAGTNGERYTST